MLKVTSTRFERGREALLQPADVCVGGEHANKYARPSYSYRTCDIVGLSALYPKTKRSSTLCAVGHEPEMSPCEQKVWPTHSSHGGGSQGTPCFVEITVVRLTAPRRRARGDIAAFAAISWSSALRGGGDG